MKFPEDVGKELLRRFGRKHREWLAQCRDGAQTEAWALEVNLASPTESQALKQVEAVRAWVAAWQAWRGVGMLSWADRRWRKLGTQSIPDKLLLGDPAEVALWIGETERWSRARQRYVEMIGRWPLLADKLPRHFDLLADYTEEDFRRLIDMIAWIQANPASNLYPRQLPVNGLDSKWLEGRKKVIAELVGAVRGEAFVDGDFYQRCGLKALPHTIRLRILDADLRARVCGVGRMVKGDAARRLSLDCALAFGQGWCGHATVGKAGGIKRGRHRADAGERHPSRAVGQVEPDVAVPW